MDAITKALQVAINAHKGQTDKGGGAYIFHPVTVALHVKTDDEKTVALLHDVVEDTDTTLNDLRAMGFSETVVQAVDAVTRRPDELRDDYLHRVKANAIATTVKIADLHHNSDLSRIPIPGEKDFARVAKYAAEIEFLES